MAQRDGSKRKGRPDWEPGMNSPNPMGRPKGIVDKRMKINQALLDDAQKVVAVVIRNALEGDMQAASLILSRVTPALKLQAEKVNFDFDPKATMTEQVEAILLAISNGAVSPDTGKQIIDTISALAGIKQLDELERRISQLEGEQ